MLTLAKSVLLVSSALACAGALAQGPAWPTQPVKFVVGYPPGGSADRMARVLAVPLAQALGQSVVVENRPGASGISASEYVLASTDNHTIFLHTTGGTSVRPHTAPLRYDPGKDFTPISTVTVVPTVFVGNPGLPVDSLPSLVAYAKANPGKLNVGIPSAGTTNHLFGALLKKEGGFDAVDIPYAGAAPALQGLMAGDVDMVNIDITNVVALVQSGKLAAYAIASEERSPFLPDVPTTAEAGFPGVVGNNTWVLYVPSTLPEPARGILQGAISTALQSAQVRESFQASSMVPQESTGAQVMQLIRDEEARLEPLIRELNLRLE